MKFTSKNYTGAAIGSVLTIAVVLAGISHLATQLAADPPQASSKVESSSQGWETTRVQITPAVGLSRTGAAQTVRPVYFQPWYKNKHWWKKNAPIVGGAAGGALIGGLAGGGKGALIGGAVGGGGGYAYKRLKHHHSEHGNHDSNHAYQEHHPDYQHHHPQ